MPKACLVLGCENRGNISGITYHSLGKKRKMKWLQAIGRSAEENLSGSNVICSKHFEESDFNRVNGRTMLKADSVPKLYLPRNATLASTSCEEPLSKRPRYSSLCSVTIPQEENEHVKESSSSDSAGLKGSPKRNRKIIRRIHTYASTLEKTKKQMKEQKQTISSLQYKIRLQKQKFKRLRKKVDHLQEIVTNIRRKQMLSTDACSVLETTFSGIPLSIMKRMFKNSKRGKVGRQKYDKVLRSFALTLHFYSSKAYEYVRQTFNLALPSQRILRKWYSNINCDPGFSQPAFDSLSVKVSENTKKGFSTLCSLMLDEISIKKHIDFHNGKSWGYVDLGTDIMIDDNFKYAQNVLVLMVVSLCGNWKLPIAYFFIDCLNGSEKANIVREALIKLKETGVIITSLTSDGPAANFTMMNCLGASMKLKNMKPYFLHPVDGYKIYCIFDACHLIKLMRNNWANLLRFIDDEGEVVDFNFIKMLHEIQEDIGLRLGNKLRAAHLDWKKQKMKVNLAVQTLSESVANSSEFLMVDLKDPRFKGAGATIRFIRLIDNLFDLLNSKNPLTVKMKMPIQEKNEDLWMPVFENASEYLKNCKTVFNKNLIATKKKTPFIGFIVTISSVIGIYEDYVKSKKIRYLLTYKLSQDHLELFFCSVRSRNGWNNNPSALQFYYSYKRLLLHHDIKNMSGNCTAQDATNVLFITSSETQHPIEATDVHVLKKYELDITDQIIYEHDYAIPISPKLTEILENVVTYIAGYVVKMTQKIIKCPTCLEALHAKDVSNENFLLLTRKKWGNLIIPANDVIIVCREVELSLRKVLSLTDNQLPPEKSFLHTFILNIHQKLAQHPNLFKCIELHNLQHLTIEENHIARLVKSLALSYYKIRMFNLAKSQSYRAKGQLIRKELNKLILFSHQ